MFARRILVILDGSLSKVIVLALGAHFTNEDRVGVDQLYLKNLDN